MRKIIRGRVYDTHTADLLAVYRVNAPMTDFRWYLEALYRKKNGEYFLHGKGNGMTPYAKTCSDGTRTFGEDITPLAEEEARSWAEEKIEASEYERIFGEAEE